MSSTQAEQNSSSTEFVEKRRASLERYLRRTAAHPILKVDPDFRDFLETGWYHVKTIFRFHKSNLNSILFLEGDLPKATSTSALSGAGVKRLFNKFGETVNKITFKMDESEPVSAHMVGNISYSLISRLISHIRFSGSTRKH